MATIDKKVKSTTKLSTIDLVSFIEIHNKRVELEANLPAVIENIKTLSTSEKDAIRDESVKIRKDYDDKKVSLENLFYEQVTIYNDIDKKKEDKLSVLIEANKLVQEELYATGESTAWVQKKEELKEIDEILIGKSRRTMQIAGEAREHKISILELNEKSQTSLQLHILVEKIDQDLL